MLDVPLLVSSVTSSADGGLACHSHCFSEDSEAVAHFSDRLVEPGLPAAFFLVSTSRLC